MYKEKRVLSIPSNCLFQPQRNTKAKEKADKAAAVKEAKEAQAITKATPQSQATPATTADEATPQTGASQLPSNFSQPNGMGQPQQQLQSQQTMFQPHQQPTPQSGPGSLGSATNSNAGQLDFTSFGINMSEPLDLTQYGIPNFSSDFDPSAVSLTQPWITNKPY